MTFKNDETNMVEMFCKDFRNEIHNGNVTTYIEDINKNPDSKDKYCWYCIDEYLESWQAGVVRIELYNILNEYIPNSEYSNEDNSVLVLS